MVVWGCDSGCGGGGGGLCPVSGDSVLLVVVANWWLWCESGGP